MSTTIISAITLIAGIALAAGALLSFADLRIPGNRESLVEKANGLLPQTQCAQCGYPGCRPYASAIINHHESINLCPPGGQETVNQLAQLLGRDALPLAENTARYMRDSKALIDEDFCIGCTHCRDACPVDAIIGAHQYMHTVITSECTGCELCLPPCPVDCINMVRIG